MYRNQTNNIASKPSRWPKTKTLPFPFSDYNSPLSWFRCVRALLCFNNNIHVRNHCSIPANNKSDSSPAVNASSPPVSVSNSGEESASSVVIIHQQSQQSQQQQQQQTRSGGCHLANKNKNLQFVPPAFPAPDVSAGNRLIKPSEYLRSLSGRNSTDSEDYMIIKVRED